MTEFSQLGLSPTTLQAVADTGYTTATPIQAQAIPVALAGQDVLGIAQTGTGKTAAFTLPMIEKLQSGFAKARMPRSLVICPTRELADQVSAAFERYAKGTKLSWALLIGGVSFADQERKLDRGVDVLIATPGRLLDHFERGKLLMTGVQIMVVDEADRMLDMGFIPDIERIFKLTPAKKQTLFFSATMPPEITRLTQQFLKDPVRIEASRPATTGENITQHLVRIPISTPKAKRMALRALVERADVRNGIVFCNRKTDVDIVSKSLKVHGLDAAPIHGDLEQSLRMKTLASFRSGELKLLVASDVAARGLDIPDVSHVFNYDVPHHADDYVHRIGRTGRAGKTGDTYMIITPADGRSLDKVLKLTGSTPKEETLDLDWSLAEGDEPRRDARGRGSDRSRGRERGGESRSGGRSRERGPRPERESQVAPSEAVPEVQSPPVAASPAAEAEAPRQRRERRPRRERPAAVEGSAPQERDDRPQRSEREPRPQQAERDERPQREERAERPRRAEQPERVEHDERPVRGVQRQPERDEGDNRVVGFGSDLPAFMAPKAGPRS